MAADEVVVKRRCCDDDPRCTRCPLVWAQLRKAGLVERVGTGRYRPTDRLTKKKLRRARRRR